MSKLRLKTTGSFPTGYQLPASRQPKRQSVRSIERQINCGWVAAGKRKGPSLTGKGFGIMKHENAAAFYPDTEPVAVGVFERGQCVHLSSDLSEAAGIILGRTELMDGRQLYEIWKAYDDDGRIGYAVGDCLCLVVVGGPACAECPLWHDGRCGAA